MRARDLLACGIVPQAQHGSFREGPLEVRLPDLHERFFLRKLIDDEHIQFGQGWREPFAPKGGFSTPSLVDQNVDLCYHAAGGCASNESFSQL
jgi:hypothetical protein